MNFLSGRAHYFWRVFDHEQRANALCVFMRAPSALRGTRMRGFSSQSARSDRDSIHMLALALWKRICSRRDV